MTPAVERRDHIRRCSSDQSKSPVGNHQSPRRKERPLVHHQTSPGMRSPHRSSSSHRMRSLAKEKVSDRARSPKTVQARSPVRTGSSHSPSPRTKHLTRAKPEVQAQKSAIREDVRNASRGEHDKGRHERKDTVRNSSSRSPSPRIRHAQIARQLQKTREQEHGRNASREGRDEGRQRRETERTSSSLSPSPRAKRLRQAQIEREAEMIKDRAHKKNARREEHDKGRHRERGDERDGPSERRLVRDKNGGASSRPRHDRSVSPVERSHRSKYSSQSPPRASKADARDEATKHRAAEQSMDDDIDSIAKMKAAEESLEAKDKQKPSFELSGKLAEETNRVRGVTLLFNEPPDAYKPDIRWRLYVFKGGEVLNEPLYVHRQSCYLFGRERRVADIPTDHPSCSKQHAVIQYRRVEKEQADGLLSKQVRPYVMDLGSTNGTFINDNRIEPQRYYELFEKDTIRFGNSSREYVILHEHSTG